MRILYIADAQSVHTRRWAEAFRDLGAQVHVASFRPALIAGVEVHRLPTGGLGSAGYLLALPVLRRLASRLRPDIVHAQYLTSYGFLAALAGLHPLVVTAWGSDVLVSPRESRLARALVGYALRHADRVTTVAEHMNAAVMALGAPAARVQAVPFGVDTALFRPPAEPRAEAPPLRVICTRNFAPVYSVHTLVEAAQQLQGRGFALALDLVGAGPLREDLQAQVQAAGLAPVTVFHGHVDHPRLVKLLGAAHVFVSPAVSDGNNVSLNEAMACGCFPVATDIPANAQWLEQGRNGLLFRPGDAPGLADAIAQAAGDAAWRAAAAAENRLIVEQRADWQVNVQRMRGIYEDLIAARETT
jgi:glycosyltransferase involved in cell wall biosynthesis